MKSMSNNKTMDIEKVEIVAYIYKQDWHRMSCYNNDADNITWHVENCMNYIIMKSEEQQTQWQCPPDLELDESWTESELLSLYQELLDVAVKAGYYADAGMVTRIRKAFAPVKGRVSW